MHNPSLTRLWRTLKLFVLGVYFLQKKARVLNTTELLLLTPYFKAPLLNSVLVVEGAVPFWLQQKMAGVVLGNIIFVRQPLQLARLQTHDISLKNAQAYLNDIEMLAHELVHVSQYAAGLNILKYLWASRYGYRQNVYEVEAYKIAAQIKEELSLSALKPVLRCK